MSVVIVESNGPVKTVTLNRPEKRNAMNADLLSGLHAAFREQPPATERVAVVRANGPVFCAGLDLRERAGTLDSPGASPIEAVLEAIEHYPLPVVAVVQGDAIAGGNELALHCDIVVASTAARFGMSLAQIGLAPTWFLAKKLLEVAGPVASREILLLGDPIPAARMHALGVISRVAEPSRLEEEAALVIDRLAANAPLSLRAMKALLVREMAFRDGIAHADVDALVEATRGSADAREGMAARLDKRPARFEGR
ncbi:MAG: enoyl-CoA hydratase/isomerase family protein [Chloroflexi bacterium]|nr:enoyl-CoA hydratase/isomerase family protein [Chloroflexota bacterium]